MHRIAIIKCLMSSVANFWAIEKSIHGQKCSSQASSTSLTALSHFSRREHWRWAVSPTIPASHAFFVQNLFFCMEVSLAQFFKFWTNMHQPCRPQVELPSSDARHVVVTNDRRCNCIARGGVGQPCGRFTHLIAWWGTDMGKYASKTTLLPVTHTSRTLAPHVFRLRHKVSVSKWSFRPYGLSSKRSCGAGESQIVATLESTSKDNGLTSWAQRKHVFFFPFGRAGSFPVSPSFPLYICVCLWSLKSQRPSRTSRDDVPSKNKKLGAVGN